MSNRVWIRERDLRDAEPHSGKARIIVDERDAKTASINGEQLVEFVRADIASTGVWDEAIRIVEDAIGNHLYDCANTVRARQLGARITLRMRAARDAALEPKGTKV